MRNFNLAFFPKWWWKLKTDVNGLWSLVIWCIHNYNGHGKCLTAKKSIPRVWLNFVKIEEEIIEVGGEFINFFI